MSTIISRIQRWTLPILCVSAALTLFSGYFTVKLYGSLRTDLEELLPAASRSVKDLDQVGRRLKSIDNLAVLVFSKNTHASKSFVLDLAEKLEAFPKKEVVGIEYRIDRELEFFKKRQALYLETKDLKKIRDYVRQKIDYETALYNPINIFSELELPEPELDFRALQNKYERRSQDYAHFPEGFFATADETKRVILIDVAGKSLGVDGVKNLKHKVETVIEGLKPRSYAPDLEIHYTGSVEEMLEEQEALVEDLAISTVVVLLLVSLAMFAFFQALWPTIALVTSLLAGTIWTFGLSYFVVGYLNANSAFLGSIVLGNGINFGIIILARYLEERRRGVAHLKACNIAISTTWRATATAALAAGVSYGSLTLTSFRGFSQFGMIGLMGMTLCWVSSYTLLPAMLHLQDRFKTWFKPATRRELRARKGAVLTTLLANSISRWPKQIAMGSCLLTGIAIYGITQARPDLLETNLEHLRSKRSIESGAALYTKYLNQIFQRFLTPMVVLPSSRQAAHEIASKLRTLKEKQGRESAIVSVQTIDDFIPHDQDEKIALLRDIRAELKPLVLSKLSAQDRKKAEVLLTPEAFQAFGIENLPPLIRDKFTESDGSLGKLVLVEPPLSKDIWQGDRLGHFINELRSVADSVEPGAPLAGGMAITADLIASISHDGPRATLMAFLAAVFLVIVLFRDPKRVALALTALLMGVTWFAGLVVGLGRYGLKINFLNFVALPITFGIGVDYGINIFERYRQRRAGGIVQIIRETGGAVGLCSFTTITGYSSLLIASNQGFISFGLLAVLGELTCVTAALVALPAILVSISKK